ncbi:MAG: hypothetical protein Q4G48_08750 [Bacteroidia bacterium]|nr:hypothetical protein [Bacteroidia bacterium]
MTTDIYELLKKYFEGETSGEEEKTLRNYFSQETVSEDLQEIAPIFTFLQDEAAVLSVLDEIRKEESAIPRKNNRLHRAMWTIAALAASLFIGIILLHRSTQTTQFTENYAWVNGEKITHPETVRHYAEKSFGNVKTEENILEEQLSFMFE